jgi:hypothetical protein
MSALNKPWDQEVAQVIQRCVQLLASKAPRLQELERMAFELIEFAFGPKRIIYHVLLVAFLQSAGMGIKLIRDAFKYSFSFLSAKGKKTLELMDKLGTAKDYAEWRKLALEMDVLVGADAWRSKDDSALIDSKIIKKRIADINDMMRRGDVFEMMFRLRGGLARDQFGMQNEKLFSKAFAGTKLIVERYHQSMAIALDYICDTACTTEEVAASDSLTFVHDFVSDADSHRRQAGIFQRDETLLWTDSIVIIRWSVPWILPCWRRQDALFGRFTAKSDFRRVCRFSDGGSYRVQIVFCRSASMVLCRCLCCF